MENAAMHSRHLAFAALLFALAACTAASRTIDPWKLELTSSGGIAGKGVGSISIDSGGAVRVTTSQGKECSFTATPAELRALQDALANAKPETWKSSYAPENVCCDRMTYELKASIGGKETAVTWIDDPLPMPADLTALIDAVRAQLRANADRCRAQ
jgi:hypothetical protein